MAILSNTQVTYASVGNKEDISDTIFQISPTDTPFVSMIAKKTKASNTTHQWQTRALAAAASNAQVQGDEFTNDAATLTSLVSNYTQISRKVASVSGTQGAVPSYGNNNKIETQVALKGEELKRDMETGLIGNQAAVIASSGVAPKLRSLEAFYITNVSRGVGGASGSTSTAATDGTQRAFTEALLKPVLQSVYNAGGNIKYMMTGASNKQQVSGFGGNSTAYRDATAGAIIAGFNIYKSDFGEIMIVPNRFQRDRTVHLIDPNYVAVSYLRSFETTPLAKSGDADRVAIVSEYTLEMQNEAAHGVVADLTTP